MPTISAISVAPVKGFRLRHPEDVELTADGVVENRRFFLVDGDGNRLRSSLTAWPVVVIGEYDADDERLRMRFPDGDQIEDSALALGDRVEVTMPHGEIAGHVVDGPWTERLSQLAGHPVRLVRPERPGATLTYPVTLVSEASVERLGQEVGERVDGRRFRMLFTIAGCRPHEEDEWDGRLVRLGDAVVSVHGAVERCAVTTRDPDSGRRDLDTLRLIKRYRGLSAERTIDFGVYAEVVEPARVRIGDAVEPLE